MKYSSIRCTYPSALFFSLLLCLCLVACDVQTSTISFGTPATVTNSGSGDIGSGAQGLKIFVEPDSTDSVITDAIHQANKSVWLEMYLLTDKKIITALEDDAHNGIDVRVMLEDHPYGGGSVSPSETLDKLSSAGVKTKTTSPSFALTHEKGMVIDGKTAYIMTSNFTLAALGESKSQNNREYGIIDTNTTDVQEVANIFSADWQRTTPTLNDSNLVVSPTNSRSDFLSLINSAKKSLSIEAEEMQDSQVEQALTAAASRGVKVQVILPSSSSSSDADGSDSNSAGIKTIKQGKVQVKEDKKLYMHAKIIIVDGQKAFVGSENISSASLDKNRELGIVISDQSVLSTLQSTFSTDWSVSKSV
jgi:cardiolipin synthase A/B